MVNSDIEAAAGALYVATYPLSHSTQTRVTPSNASAYFEQFVTVALVIHLLLSSLIVKVAGPSPMLNENI